ncbi:CvfD/Ygs/GSP13 family RNA-binding post-transcriptional regulator [Weissella sp. GP1]|uniref:S1 RNA-binding domain-containing protein n=2 Tax=Weissella TaxID=46255 RepID=A0AAJ2Z108_WEICO|nr:MULTISPECIES: CvfD/Ygs/GSP13 family RNA-binding post-transcriptional regulator [Weissella]MBJ7689492.1 S1 RNA-binding domain-containing protein [Weissella confusa]MBJ7695670.1 S1 RNA-binding domain-containing protein [Weissella confusa]MCW0926370.1 CvfD/Ygs/GSP13 family RNA-binding post-transcriptional regulator [Weissella sp. LMG 11983]MDF9298789.1 CvfD/Ygs/GSP13 family RNA-binding post-transcriptional regulator [Weissella sp. BK2]NBA12591.1 S1 RNA-binding domain-containing protein [Weisse
MTYHIGEVVQGTVTGIQPYGAFVQLDDHTQGLIHISECRSAFIRHVGDELHVGQVIDVMILDVDQYNEKISLSRRSVLDANQKVRTDRENQRVDNWHHHYWTNQHLNIGFDTIADNRDDMIAEALQRLNAHVH